MNCCSLFATDRYDSRDNDSFNLWVLLRNSSSAKKYCYAARHLVARLGYNLAVCGPKGSAEKILSFCGFFNFWKMRMTCQKFNAIPQRKCSSIRFRFVNVCHFGSQKSTFDAVPKDIVRC